MFNADPSKKRCPTSMPFLHVTSMNVGFPPAEFWLVNSNFRRFLAQTVWWTQNRLKGTRYNYPYMPYSQGNLSQVITVNSSIYSSPCSQGNLYYVIFKSILAMKADCLKKGLILWRGFCSHEQPKRCDLQFYSTETRVKSNNMIRGKTECNEIIIPCSDI